VVNSAHWGASTTASNQENRSAETASSQPSTEQEIGEVGRIFFVQSIKQYHRIYINTATT